MGVTLVLRFFVNFKELTNLNNRDKKYFYSIPRHQINDHKISTSLF